MAKYFERDGRYFCEGDKFAGSQVITKATKEQFDAYQDSLKPVEPKKTVKKPASKSDDKITGA